MTKETKELLSLLSSRLGTGTNDSALVRLDDTETARLLKELRIDPGPLIERITAETTATKKNIDIAERMDLAHEGIRKRVAILIGAATIGTLGVAITTVLLVQGVVISGNAKFLAGIFLFGFGIIALNGLVALLYVYSTAFAYQMLMLAEVAEETERLAQGLASCAGDSPGLIEKLKTRTGHLKILDRHWPSNKAT